LNWTAITVSQVDMTSAVLWLCAWFLTIGLHEGGHAWMAWWRGDDTAYLLGKRTINPIQHIDKENKFNLFATVGLPVLTVFTMGWPIGFAWVPVNPGKMRNPLRDSALVSAAGPMGNAVGALIGAAVLALMVLITARLGDGLVLHPFQFIKGDTSVALALIAHLGYRMMLINVLLGIINLLPIPGVDGGYILYYFLNARGREIFNQLRPYGLLIFFLIAWILLARPIRAVFDFVGHDVVLWMYRTLG
jgi:Zn-dependent protease